MDTTVMSKKFLVYIGHDEIKPIPVSKSINMNAIKRILNGGNIDVSVYLFKNKFRHFENLIVGLSDSYTQDAAITVQFSDLTYVCGSCVLCNWNTTLGEGKWLTGLSYDSIYWTTEQLRYYDKQGNYKGTDYIWERIIGELSMLS
ncbi:MAG: hypothetical protein IGS23_14000 [Rivularia sp. T60_A2020_040]|nr:hypothetical protein [Rivularia sp. T60_A2020_040]